MLWFADGITILAESEGDLKRIIETMETMDRELNMKILNEHNDDK